MTDSSEYFSSVNVHTGTVELVDELKPEYMSRSAFVDGAVWKFYGHLGHGKRRLTPTEHKAIYSLKESGVKHKLLVDAFGVSRSTINNVQSTTGEGGKTRLEDRQGGDSDDE